ncbi:hypothetical protein ACGFZB_38565 [Streptomyces cinerochromogenes]|uniref:Uncharacterized protein n=1 Tax=Streptomyces cinerochromogenes TaxID=66422 RepID=A0ABW7BGB9_9ACTN
MPLKRLHTLVGAFVRVAGHPEPQRPMDLEGGQSGDPFNHTNGAFMPSTTSGGTAMFANQALPERLFADARWRSRAPAGLRTPWPTSS